VDMWHGWWVRNRNSTQWKLLIPKASQAELSADFSHIAFVRRDSLYVGSIVRVGNTTLVWQIPLGSRDSIAPGDWIGVFAPKINPLNNTVVGYLDTLQRATAFVYEVGPESSQIVLHEVASTVTSSDVVVARTTRWAALRPGPTLLETQVDSLYRLLCVRWHAHFATPR